MSAGAIVLSDACAIGLPALFVVWLLRHARDYAATSDLTRRGNVIVKGVVEAESVPVFIEYKQRRWHLHHTEAGQRPGVTAVYEWEEEERTIKATPFVLRTPELRIQVDPDEDDVSLLWDPDHPRAWRDLDFVRINRASLQPGAEVEIFGSFRPAGGAVLPMLVPSRVERLLISKQPIAPKFVAMRRYLAMRACATVAAVGVLHVAYAPVWQADLAQLGLAAPSYDVRAWIGVGFAAIAYYFLRKKRPWRDGKCNQVQVVTSSSR